MLFFDLFLFKRSNIFVLVVFSFVKPNDEHGMELNSRGSGDMDMDQNSIMRRASTFFSNISVSTLVNMVWWFLFYRYDVTSTA